MPHFSSVDALVDYLSTSCTPCAVDQEDLSALGRRAAAAYVNEGALLNDTIRTMAKEASLNPEQVQRVVEFANNATFVAMMSKVSSGSISFPVADGAQIGETTPAPGQEKVASVMWVPPVRGRYIPGAERLQDEDIFAGHSFEKVAEAQGPSQAELSRKYAELSGELSHAEGEVARLEETFIVKAASLHQACDLALREGNSVDEVRAAIETAAPSVALLSVLRTDVLGEITPDYGSRIALQKLAAMGALMEPQNPITGLTQDLEEVAGKLVATQQAVMQTQTSMAALLEILRGPDAMSPAAQLFMGAPPPSGLPAGVPPVQAPPGMTGAGVPMAGPPAGPVAGMPPGAPTGPM